MAQCFFLTHVSYFPSLVAGFFVGVLVVIVAGFFRERGVYL